MSGYEVPVWIREYIYSHVRTPTKQRACLCVKKMRANIIRHLNEVKLSQKSYEELKMLLTFYKRRILMTNFTNIK